MSFEVIFAEYLIGQKQANRLHMCLESNFCLRRRQRLHFIKKYRAYRLLILPKEK